MSVMDTVENKPFDSIINTVATTTLPTINVPLKRKSMEVEGRKGSIMPSVF